MGLIMRTAVLSDLGLRRTNNEDAAYAGRRLLAVADGMGGLPAGELASELAIRTLAALDERATGDDPVGALREAFDAASATVRAAAEADAVRDGMGTTLTALLFTGDRLAMMHVGDSRAYRLRDGALEQLTHDDTYVQALVDSGVLTAQGARTHPQRSLVTQAMQGGPISPHDALLDVRAGDAFLLCSDGLSDVVPDETIAEILRRQPDLDRAAADLVAAAVAEGAPDNVTVLLATLDPA
jgi:protein phosphatase